MTSSGRERPLSIFVHRASELLTDHESFGDGLICFSLLNGLAQRGHYIYAYTDHAAIHHAHPHLVVRDQRHRSPANSLAPWEHSWRANRWFRDLLKQHPVDLVWRMQPCGLGCPDVPLTCGKPLVIGPIFYNWPDSNVTPPQGRPRLGIGLGRLLKPIAERGWQRTLRQASLLMCATENHAATMRKQYVQAQSLALPLIVTPPAAEPAGRPPASRPPVGRGLPLHLIFVANLMPYKNPQIFCDTVAQLRADGIDADGTIVGDGPERPALEAYCRAAGLDKAIRLLGKIPNHEVWSHLRQAHFLVSYSLGEPYGRSIAEAMAVGTPAVCHHSGGPGEFMDNEQDGLLVPHLEAGAYAAMISRFATAEAWPSLSTHALAKAGGWTHDIVIGRLEHALYEIRAQACP